MSGTRCSVFLINLLQGKAAAAHPGKGNANVVRLLSHHRPQLRVDERRHGRRAAAQNQVAASGPHHLCRHAAAPVARAAARHQARRGGADVHDVSARAAAACQTVRKVSLEQTAFPTQG